MITLKHVMAYVAAYRASHGGRLPPSLEFSVDEHRVLLREANNMVLLPRGTRVASIEEIMGIPVRIVEE